MGGLDFGWGEGVHWGKFFLIGDEQIFGWVGGGTTLIPSSRENPAFLHKPFIYCLYLCL